MNSKYRYNIHVVVVCLIFIFMISCKPGYPDIKPLSVQKGEITFKGMDGEQVKTTFIFSAPEQYNPEKSWPVLIALHGSGSNADAFLDIFKPVTDRLGLVLVALRGERKTGDGFGWRWGRHAERSLLTCLEIIQKQIPVDSRKLFLLGFSSGGSIAYEIGIKNAGFFKGMALLSAPFDSTHLKNPDRQINHLRIFIAHGEYEKRYQNETQKLVQQLKRQCEEVDYRIFEKTGHSLPEPKEEIIIEILYFLLDHS